MITIKIRVLAEERKIGATRLAKLTGMSRSTLYNIYENKKCPTLEEMERFARILGVYIEDLYESPYSRYYNEKAEEKPIELQNCPNFWTNEPNPLKSEEK